MTARLIVRWSISDPDATMWQLERTARTEWSGHVAAAGIWATEEPAFTIDGEGDDLTLIGAADAILGPIEIRSHRSRA